MKKLIEVVEKSIGEKLEKSIYDFAPNESLLDAGLDSIGFITMIIDLEEAYDIFIDDDGLLLDNLATLESIQKYIQNKKK